jgi:acetone carboxylase gamma subunit
MKRTRTYYCKECKSSTEVAMPTAETIKCKCGYIFGGNFNNTKDYVNMRTTWSGTTKMEFRETTMADSMTDMGIKH